LGPIPNPQTPKPKTQYPNPKILINYKKNIILQK